jgi:hypothetical protein
MSKDSAQCHHVLVRLPDGRYFDGGSGVVTKSFLAALFPGSHIEEMANFDLALLDKRSYGLSRSYPECPNYSDDYIRHAIAQQLDVLARESKRSERIALRWMRRKSLLLSVCEDHIFPL